jgi:hypothetical protein
MILLLLAHLPSQRMVKIESLERIFEIPPLSDPQWHMQIEENKYLKDT